MLHGSVRSATMKRPAEIGLDKVRPAEVCPAEIGRNIRICATPAIPGIHPSSEHGEMLVVGHCAPPVEPECGRGGRTGQRSYSARDLFSSPHRIGSPTPVAGTTSRRWYFCVDGPLNTLHISTLVTLGWWAGITVSAGRVVTVLIGVL